MKFGGPLVWVLIFVVLAGWAGFFWVATPGGDKPFIPSRSEWLAVEAAAADSCPIYRASPAIMFGAKREDTILVVMGYHDSEMTAADLALAEGRAKVVIKRLAKNRGWDEWVKVEVKRIKFPAAPPSAK